MRTTTRKSMRTTKPMRTRNSSRTRNLLRPLAAGAALLALAAPAHAAGDGLPEKQRGVFLTVSGDQNTWIRGVLLRCAPEPSGHHPHAAEACAALDAAGGDFDDLAGEPRVCTDEFDPVSVSATGVHRGRMTGWHRTFANLCVMRSATGPVFDF